MAAESAAGNCSVIELAQPTRCECVVRFVHLFVSRLSRASCQKEQGPSAPARTHHVHYVHGFLLGAEPPLGALSNRRAMSRVACAGGARSARGRTRGDSRRRGGPDCAAVCADCARGVSSQAAPSQTRSGAAKTADSTQKIANGAAARRLLIVGQPSSTRETVHGTTLHAANAVTARCLIPDNSASEPISAIPVAMIRGVCARPRARTARPAPAAPPARAVPATFLVVFLRSLSPS